MLRSAVRDPWCAAESCPLIAPFPRCGRCTRWPSAEERRKSDKVGRKRSRTARSTQNVMTTQPSVGRWRCRAGDGCSKVRGRHCSEAGERVSGHGRTQSASNSRRISRRSTSSIAHSATGWPSRQQPGQSSQHEPPQLRRVPPYDCCCPNPARMTLACLRAISE